MPEAVIVATARTPMGRYGGQLKDVRPDDLAAIVLKEACERAHVMPEEVEDVILGCANQAGEDNRNVARMALLLAGFPVEVPGQTVNRLCGSGMQATIAAAREIQSGAADIMVAGGVESMTRAPWVMPKPDGGFLRGSQTAYDTALGWRLVNPKMATMYGTLQMGETAERVAQKYEVSREEQDAFALRSHQRAVAARRSGRLAEEIVPVSIAQRKGEPLVVSDDEGPRPDSTLESLAKLKPAFAENGSVTAGNASPLNDGATALVLMSNTKARERGLQPLARLVAAAPAGVHPDYMGIGPVPSSLKALEKAGLHPGDMAVVELNEAFASQSLACIRLLGLDEERVNVNGGAIALGGVRPRHDVHRRRAGHRFDLAENLSERDPDAVRSMFDRIAGRYDTVNTVLSAGTDAGWRRQAARETGLRPGGSALDVACGSGKLAAELAKLAGGGRVVGIDFSPQMLAIARREHPQIEFIEGDALNLPFDDASFDASTIAFGLRNLADPLRGLREMRRVTRGHVVVLEFVRPPKGVVGAAYRTYLRALLPVIGGLVSGQPSAYRYLSDTVDTYRTPEELTAMARAAGWSDARFHSLAMGTVGIVTGT